MGASEKSKSKMRPEENKIDKEKRDINTLKKKNEKSESISDEQKAQAEKDGAV